MEKIKIGKTSLKGVLTTTVVGSYTRPRWLVNATQDHRKGVIATSDLEELREMAKLLTIKEMEDSGIDMVTDGEQGRTGFYVYLAEACTGFGRRTPETAQPTSIFEQVDWRHKSMAQRPVIVNKVDWVGEPLSAKDCRFLKEHTKRKVKVTVASPSLVLRRLWKPSTTYPTEDSFIDDLIRLSAGEIKAIAVAGADFIQIDSPELTTYADDEIPRESAAAEVEKSVDLINKVISSAGVNVKIGLHACWGNIKGTHRADGPLARIYPWLLKLKVDQLVLELASARHEDDVEVFKEYPSMREIGAGVLDVKTPDVEPVRVVRKRIERVLRFVEPERLWLNGDCGFAPTWDAEVVPRKSCYEKLRSMALAANEVKNSLKTS